MEISSFVASVLAAVAVLLIPYLLYRVARWARAQTTGAYVLGAVFAPIIAAGSVVDPDSRIVNEAKQNKEHEEDDPGDPPDDEKRGQRMRSVGALLLVVSATAVCQPPASWPDGIESLLVQYFSDYRGLDPLDVVVHCTAADCNVTLSLQADSKGVTDAFAGLIAQRYNVWQGSIHCRPDEPQPRTCRITLSNVMHQD